MVIGPLLHRIRAAREGPTAHILKGFRIHVSSVVCLPFAAWAGLMAIATTAHSDPAFPPGSRVGLEVPGDMKPSTHFPGFEDADRKVSIAILDLPSTAYFELETAAFSKLPQDLQQSKRESFPFNTGIGVLDQRSHAKRWNDSASVVAACAGGGRQGPKSYNLDQCGGAGKRAPGLLRCGGPQGARKRHVSSGADQRTTWFVTVQIWRPGRLQVMQVTPTGTVILADKPDDKSNRSPDPDRFNRARRSRRQPVTAADLHAIWLQHAPVRELEHKIGRTDANQWRAGPRNPGGRQRPGGQAGVDGSMVAFRLGGLFAYRRRRPHQQMGSVL